LLSKEETGNMFKNFKDKIALSGITVLIIGIALLIFTFISAYGFLTQSLSIIASEDLVRTFGEALAPLIGTCIRIMYLGVMGWIGSLVTIRGVTIIAHAPETPTTAIQKSFEAKLKPPLPQRVKTEEPQKEPLKPEAKEPEAKPSEPEFVVIPPEQVSQPQRESRQGQKEKSEPSPQEPAS
jgi:hypothetical protein